MRIHESWNGDVTNGYDIALLMLEREAPWKLPALAYSANPVKYGTQLLALGWGRNEFGQSETYLQVGFNLPFIPESGCNHRDSWDGLVKEYQICAGLMSTDTCNGKRCDQIQKDWFFSGDSGGPLLLADLPRGRFPKGSPLSDLVVGIASFGPKECDGSKPAVYTNVGYFKDWIRSIVKPETTSV